MKNVIIMITKDNSWKYENSSPETCTFISANLLLQSRNGTYKPIERKTKEIHNRLNNKLSYASHAMHKVTIKEIY